MKSTKVLILLTFLILTGCGEKSDVTTGKDTTATSKTQSNGEEFPPEIVKRLDSVLNHAMIEDSIPGVVGGIWIPGTGEFTFSKGTSELGKDSPRTTDQIIRIGSITKTFTATVFLQLCDEGKVALNDKLDKYFPQVPNAKDVTMRMLLDMTSGYGDFLDSPPLDSAFFHEGNNSRKFTDEEILELSIKLPVKFSPGEQGKWNYSNINYLLLGMIIKKVTNNSWESEITNRIIKKLNLTNTEVPTSPNLPSPFAHGYMKDTATGEIKDVTVMEPSITGAAGCMISNINDLTIWSKALSDGTLLSDTMQAERMKLVPTFVMDFMKYGLGILDFVGFSGHNGGVTGYNTSMYYNVDKNALFVLNVNMFGRQGGVSDKIFTGLAKVIYPDVPWK